MLTRIVEMQNDENIISWIKQKHAETIYESIIDKQKESISLKDIVLIEENKTNYIRDN